MFKGKKPIDQTPRSKVKVEIFKLCHSVHLNSAIESSRQVGLKSCVTIGQNDLMGSKIEVKVCNIKHTSCSISFESGFNRKQQ